MSKEQILSYFTNNAASLTATSILTILLFGLAIAIIINLTYRYTYDGVSYSTKFNTSITLILLITIVIMLMISSNIVISLGMVGALSIVRFRTAVKDSRDTIFIFWAIVEGLCVGSQNNKLALLSTVFIAIVIFLYSFLTVKSKHFMLIVRTDKPVDTDVILQIMKKHTRFASLRTANLTDTRSEIIFEYRVKGTDMNMPMVQEIQAIDGVVSVNGLLDSNNTIG